MKSGGMAQAVELLLSKCKTLSSNPSTAKTKMIIWFRIHFYTILIQIEKDKR
jgi:hypothetical protein